MNILVIGSQLNLDETKQKFGAAHQWHYSSSHQDVVDRLHHADVVFDFVPDHLTDISLFNETTQSVFFNTAFITLGALCKSKKTTFNTFGFCGMPTFLNREVLEVTSLSEDKTRLEEVCKKLNTDFAVVEDRVGLVTPRIICMIINEAFYTVEEGTASRTDIDLAMKLGTNYPFGPFEWCNRIGARQVRDLLTAVHNATGDERYLICSLLKEEAKSNP